MRLRAFCSALLFSLLSLVIVFSGGSIKAYAIDLPSGGHFLTPEETRTFLGDSMTVTYWNGSEYVDAVASYDSVKSDPAGFVEYSESPVGFVSATGVLWLQYTCTLTGYNNNNNYIAFRCHPSYSLYDTEYIYTCYAFTSASQISSTYTSPSSDWYIGGTNIHFENNSLSSANSGYHSYLRGNSGSSNNLQYCSYVPVVHTSASAFSGYSIQATFQGNTGYRGYPYFTFFVMCPYVSGDAYGNSGTFVTGSGGSGPGVDLTETNGLLDSILDGLSGIGNVISGLFVPDQEDITDFKEDVADILYDSFSGYSDTQDMLDDVKDVLISSNPSAVLEFPALSIPGTSFQTPAKRINLNFDNATIEWVKYIIDIMATIAVVNMIQNKIKAVLVGESVVEVEEIDG